MSGVTDGSGYQKTLIPVERGIIIGFHGPVVPEGWAFCDGTNGTPDLRGAMLAGASAVGLGTAGGTVDASVPLAHSNFSVGNHSNHAPTQPSAHSSHTPTQSSAHSAHVVAQPSDHSAHNTQGAHTHDDHSGDLNSTGLGALAQIRFSSIHLSDGGHTHTGAHTHSGFAVNAHTAHSGFAVDAHSAHSGFAVDAHSAHVVGQPDAHSLKGYKLAFIMKV